VSLPAGAGAPAQPPPYQPPQAAALAPPAPAPAPAPLAPAAPAAAQGFTVKDVEKLLAKLAKKATQQIRRVGHNHKKKPYTTVAEGIVSR
jgi:3-oxoacyl-ACP reductase-like protein